MLRVANQRSPLRSSPFGQRPSLPLILLLFPRTIRTPGSIRLIFWGDLPITIRIQTAENFPAFFFREFLEKFPFTKFVKVQPPTAVHIKFTKSSSTFGTFLTDLMDLLFAQSTVTIPIKSTKNPFELLLRKSR